jgi:quercetin dioxygenase-like cupin family protein
VSGKKEFNVMDTTVATNKAKVLATDEGLRLQSGPGRDLIFKVTGEDTGGAFDYFIVQVAPRGGPPLHVHHKQEETIHVLKGRYKVRIGDEIYHVEEGGFAYMPSNLPHTFLNLTDQPGEIIVVYTPGGGHKFYEEFGPIARMGPPDPKVIGPLFTKYDMTLLGPPLTPD